MGDGALTGLFWGHCKNTQTKSPPRCQLRHRPTNRCQRMQSPGAIDRFHHFEFKNPEVGGTLDGASIWARIHHGEGEKIFMMRVVISLVESLFQHTCLNHLQDCVVNGD